MCTRTPIARSPGQGQHLQPPESPGQVVESPILGLGLAEPASFPPAPYTQFPHPDCLLPSLADFVGTTVSSVLRPTGDVSGWGVLPCPVAHSQGP